METINFNAPHVIFLDATKKLCFAEVSKGYHKSKGCKILGVGANFKLAAAYVKRKIERKWKRLI